MGRNITKKWLLDNNACSVGYNWFCNQKEKDEINVIKQLMKEKRFSWANWVIARRIKYNQYVEYIIYSAKQVLSVYEKKFPDDNRPRKAIKAAEICIKNQSKKNKKHATELAHAASDAFYEVYGIDTAAAYAAADAANAAYNSAYIDYYNNTICLGSCFFLAINTDYINLKKKIIAYGISLIKTKP